MDITNTTAPTTIALVRLVYAIQALEAFRGILDTKYGDQELRATDTLAYLDRIGQATTPLEKVVLSHLSSERAEASRACTEEEIALAIDLAADSRK